MMRETKQPEMPVDAGARQGDTGKPLPKGPDGRDLRVVLLIGLSALIARGLFLTTPYGMTGDADEAVFGLMAQKIGALEEFPYYCWQAHYASALVSYVGAVLFHFLGTGFVQLRLAMLPLAVLTPVILYGVYRRIFPFHLALAASLFIIFCPPTYAHLSMAALGGYGEIFFGTALVIWLCLRLGGRDGAVQPARSLFSLGVACGFLFYVSYFITPAVLAFAIPAVRRAQSKNDNAQTVCLAGFTVGALPFIAYNLTSGGGSFTRGASRSFGVGREIVAMAPGEQVVHVLSSKASLVQAWLARLPENMGTFLLPGTGSQALAAVVGTAAIGLIAWFSAEALYSRDRWMKARSSWFRPLAAFLILYILFCFIANLDRARHFSGLYVALPACLFALAKGRLNGERTALVALCGLMIIQTLLSFDMFRMRQFDPRPAAAAMRDLGLREFYGSYASVYPIMFASESRCMGAPVLAAAGDPLTDRCPDCTARVRAAASPAFVFLVGEMEERRAFERFLGERGIAFAVKDVNGTGIYYDLSVPVDVNHDPGRQGRFVVRRTPAEGVRNGKTGVNHGEAARKRQVPGSGRAP